MTKIKTKHIVEEVDGVRCTVVETGLNQKRLNFLKDILEFNKFVTKIEKEANSQDAYKLGVTDISFNLIIAIYDRSLKLKDGKSVNQEYWLQQKTETKPYYWK